MIKSLLRISAAALILAAVVFWSATGMNRGWTKTSVPRKHLDEVTGIEGVTYEKRFVPGIDFLAAAGLAGALLAGTSLFVRKKRTGT